MKKHPLSGIFLIAISLTVSAIRTMGADASAPAVGPDPNEIPLPPIKTPIGPLPGVNELPVHKEMPDVLTMNDGTKVTTPAQWQKRREEMKQILEYYAVGQAPPPPGNVKGKELISQLTSDGTARYRLVHLTFGPEEKLTLDIGIYTPIQGGPFPTVIAYGGTPPGGTSLPTQGQGPTQGRSLDVLLVVGNGTASATPAAPRGGARGPAAASPNADELAKINAALKALIAGADPDAKTALDKYAMYNPIPIPAAAPAAGRAGGGLRGGRGGGASGGALVVNAPRGEGKEYLDHGFAYVTFNNNDCGEDTTLRNADGSWAFRNAGFFPAYPNYDWGLLRSWAWGASRVVDYLVTDPAIDKDKLVITGVSRTGKAALVAGAFDDRISMVAPGASSGGGTPAYRFSGAGRGGKEGLDEMVKKYPNWFSPHLHEFWGHQDQLPFDEHWFIALAAPRPFIALEGDNDQNVVINGVRQSWLAAKPAYALFGVPDRVGVNWAPRMHGSVQGDWDALVAFADKFLLGKQVDRTFDKFPDEPATAAQPAP